MDVLANMLITIKNGGNAQKDFVHVPFSGFKQSVAKALFDKGYIAGYEKKDRNRGADVIAIELKYGKDSKPRVLNVKRVSKPSCRVYGSTKDIYQVKEGRGDLFLSTPKGVLSGDEAKKEQVGGELLFEIW